MIRVAIIGLGYRGLYLLKLLSSLAEWVQVVALADPSPEASLYKGDWRIYEEGREDYKRMIDHETLDLVLIASPWACQVEQALYAVRAGLHIALEIKGGLYLGEYDELLQAIQGTDLRVYPLENVLFKREIMALMRLCDAGLLGDIVYMRGGYRHDLRPILLNSAGELSTTGEGRWRINYYAQGQADLYPTHSFAPLALLAGLREPSDITHVQSIASGAWGLRDKMNPATREAFADRPLLGDVVSTQISTKQGILISLIHDTTLPRPRSLDWQIQGTKGIWDGDRRMIYIEGVSPHEAWEDDATLLEQYEHHYWHAWGALALEQDAHHKGMDYIMLRAMVEDLLGQEAYPVGLSDLALWCSITPLSRLANPQNKITDTPEA